MSRQNKVNPGMYTQRGRLSQDDAARELRKQSVMASPHTWQPVQTQMRQRLAPAGDAARDTGETAENEATAAKAKTEAPLKGRPTSKRATSKGAAKAASSNAKAKAAKAKTTATRKSKSTPAKAKTVKAKTTAMKRTTKSTRKAVRTRKVGSRGAAPRRTTTRRKS